MSVQVETLEKNMAKLTIEVPADKVEQALQEAYIKQRKMIRIPGFRKGKVPRIIVEKMYGPEIFYEDAADQLIRENYKDAADESTLEIVSRPLIDIVQIKKGEPFVFTAEVALKPPVVLGEYKGILVSKADTSVTEEEVDEAIERERDYNARIITVDDRAVLDGDTVIIDYEGFADGRAFDGGKGENQPLEIGSHSFIDTFEEQLIGKNSGDEVEVHVTFPEEYYDKSLAGKDAVFQVKIHEIRTKERPDLDDEFAQDISEFDTLEEYRADLKDVLAKEKEESVKRAQEDEAVRQIAEAASMEIPDAMIETQVEIMIDEFAQRISLQGLSFEQYLQISGMTLEKMKEQVRTDAISRIRSSLAMEQIAKEENIEVTEEDFEEEAGKIAKSYNMDKEKVLSSMSDSEKKSIKKDLAIQKAIDFVMAHVIEQ